MRTQKDRGDDLSIGRLVEAYDEYVALLVQSERGTLGLAVAHGYRYSPEAIKRGQELRERIAHLKKELVL